eukprot:TRINITY_DN18836_c0_g1_i1.p1 TRINITY_DN18836_c0_g1~~TRINITY_DN18836_c0_g1_i1.p1  ORF type:complete len:1757 (+),score=410.38 TRINITY_DN18836_c0_g1_i1:207-5477(+)
MAQRQRQRATVIEAATLFVTGHAPVAGAYDVEVGVLKNLMPLWKRRGGGFWLFSGPSERWFIGDDFAFDEDFTLDEGEICAKDAHAGQLPHESGDNAWWKLVGDEWQDADGFHVGLADPPPPVLVVRFLYGFGGAYRLYRDVEASGHPVWKRDNAEHYLFSGPCGRWFIGDEAEKDADFERSSGVFTTKAPHYGLPPQLVAGGWWFLTYGAWKDATGFEMTAENEDYIDTNAPDKKPALSYGYQASVTSWSSSSSSATTSSSGSATSSSTGSSRSAVAQAAPKAVVRRGDHWNVIKGKGKGTKKPGQNAPARKAPGRLRVTMGGEASGDYVRLPFDNSTEMPVWRRAENGKWSDHYIFYDETRRWAMGSGKATPFDADAVWTLRLLSQVAEWNGNYDLVPRHEDFDKPVWKKRDARLWIYLGLTGHWFLGGEDEEANGFHCHSGEMRSIALATSGLPHAVEGGWLKSTPKGWVKATDVLFTDAEAQMPKKAGRMREEKRDEADSFQLLYRTQVDMGANLPHEIDKAVWGRLEAATDFWHATSHPAEAMMMYIVSLDEPPEMDDAAHGLASYYYSSSSSATPSVTSSSVSEQVLEPVPEDVNAPVRWSVAISSSSSATAPSTGSSSEATTSSSSVTSSPSTSTAVSASTAESYFPLYEDVLLSDLPSLPKPPDAPFLPAFPSLASSLPKQDLPRRLHVHSSLIPGFSGIYELHVKDKETGHFVWRTPDCTRFLFSSSSGHYYFGDAEDEARGLRHDGRHIASRRPHCGLWPDKVALAGGWLRSEDARSWIDYSQLRIDRRSDEEYTAAVSLIQRCAKSFLASMTFLEAAREKELRQQMLQQATTATRQLFNQLVMGKQGTAASRMQRAWRKYQLAKTRFELESKAVTTIQGRYRSSTAKEKSLKLKAAKRRLKARDIGPEEPSRSHDSAVLDSPSSSSVSSSSGGSTTSSASSGTSWHTGSLFSLPYGADLRGQTINEIPAPPALPFLPGFPALLANVETRMEPPKQFYIEGADMVDGKYLLMLQDATRGWYVWRRLDGFLFMYTAPCGHYYVGDVEDEASGFTRNHGLLASRRPHLGAWPDQISATGGWLLWMQDPDGWEVCLDIEVAPWSKTELRQASAKITAVVKSVTAYWFMMDLLKEDHERRKAQRKADRLRRKECRRLVKESQRRLEEKKRRAVFNAVDLIQRATRGMLARARANIVRERMLRAAEERQLRATLFLKDKEYFKAKLEASKEQKNLMCMREEDHLSRLREEVEARELQEERQQHAILLIQSSARSYFLSLVLLDMRRNQDLQRRHHAVLTLQSLWRMLAAKRLSKWMARQRWLRDIKSRIWRGLKRWLCARRLVGLLRLQCQVGQKHRHRERRAMVAADADASRYRRLLQRTWRSWQEERPTLRERQRQERLRRRDELRRQREMAERRLAESKARTEEKRAAAANKIARWYRHRRWLLVTEQWRLAFEDLRQQVRKRKQDAAIQAILQAQEVQQRLEKRLWLLRQVAAARTIQRHVRLRWNAQAVERQASEQRVQMLQARRQQREVFKHYEAQYRREQEELSLKKSWLFTELEAVKLREAEDAMAQQQQQQPLEWPEAGLRALVEDLSSTPASAGPMAAAGVRQHQPGSAGSPKRRPRRDKGSGGGGSVSLSTASTSADSTASGQPPSPDAAIDLQLDEDAMKLSRQLRSEALSRMRIHWAAKDGLRSPAKNTLLPEAYAAQAGLRVSADTPEEAALRQAGTALRSRVVQEVRARWAAAENG